MAWQVERLTPSKKMFVKMLTHLHMLVHTRWCWHTLIRRLSLKGREGFRVPLSLPSL